MKLTFTVLSKLLIVLIIIGGLSVSGCESDPILSPQVEAEEEGGSYGNTNLPVNQNQNTQNQRTGNTSKVNQRPVNNVRNKTNPTLF